MKSIKVLVTLFCCLSISMYYSCDETTGISEILPPSFSGEFYPTEHEGVSSLQPMLWVRNFEDFNGRDLTYDFELFTDNWDQLLDQGLDIAESAQGYEEYTGWKVNITLQFGQIYYWRVRAKSEVMEGPWEVNTNFRVKPIFPPTPYSPKDGETIDALIPTLCALNSLGIPGQRTYDFEIYADESATQLLAQQTNILETSSMTCWTSYIPLTSNQMYYWRVRGNMAGEYSDWSEPEPFFICACESLGGDQFAQAVVVSNVDDCDGMNDHMDATEALGPPNASGDSESTYRGFVSLGLGGSIILDMGVCIINGPGNDFLVHQYISNEGIEVLVSSCETGTYHSLGWKPCAHPSCGFDISDIPLNQIRFVQIVDRSEIYPCYAHIGADIDAVQAIYFH